MAFLIGAALIVVCGAVAMGVAVAKMRRPNVSLTDCDDPAWAPTGVKQSFTGYDQAMGARGRHAAIERAKAQRKAADVKTTRAVVVSFDQRKGQGR